MKCDLYRGRLCLRVWDGTEAIPPRGGVVVEGVIFYRFKGILGLRVLACSVRGPAGAFDGAGN